MRQRQSLNVGGLICLIILIYFIYKILLEDEILPFSIDAVYQSISLWLKHWQILAVGLLPIYVALVFFGTAIFGFFFGSAIQHWLSRFKSKKNL